ncbi:MAG: carbon starvation CstA family protein [Peptostreptococcaceae bacterium]|nr:carbon starvation CstA family protein [Peptostreptococcaceae bacterium]
MITFLIGMAILVVGGVLYGAYIDKMFGADDRKTPAVTMNDGVDFVPMNKWKNGLIQLLNIAGTGPILGPIAGILFGPIAFIAIPVGCVLGGAVHDYLSGMISIRENGAQMPVLTKKYLGKFTFQVYNFFLWLLMLLVGAVFIYTPGDLIVTQIFKQESVASNPIVWIVYAGIFVYYLVATLFPIDKIIGKVYPIFGGILLLSAVGVFFGLFAKGYQLDNLTASNWMGVHPEGLPLIPVFFVTVACGIVSGFHSTQSTLIARSVSSEREGKFTFFYMMLLEGFIAMIWAAAAMGIYHIIGLDADGVGGPKIIGMVAKDLLGPIGGMIAVIGVIVLPITSGDTALRSLRLMVADYLNIDQKPYRNRLMVSAVIFALAAGILVFAKVSAGGFQLLWRYFAWSNQTIAVFAFAIMAVYLMKEGKNFLVALIPGTFYMFIISSFILNAKIGFRLPINTAYIVGGVLTALYVLMVYKTGLKMKSSTRLQSSLTK